MKKNVSLFPCMDISVPLNCDLCTISKEQVAILMLALSKNTTYSSSGVAEGDGKVEVGVGTARVDPQVMQDWGKQSGHHKHAARHQLVPHVWKNVRSTILKKNI